LLVFLVFCVVFGSPSGQMFQSGFLEAEIIVYLWSVFVRAKHPFERDDTPPVFSFLILRFFFSKKMWSSFF